MFGRVNSGGRALEGFPGNRSCAPTWQPRSKPRGMLITNTGNGSKVMAMLAVGNTNRYGYALKAVLGRCNVLVRTVLGSIWVLTAPWLAVLVART